MSTGSTSSQGSSPLTRGKRPHVLRGHHHRGLIPAHAGKTSGRRRSPPSPWAHPRSRGENSISSRMLVSWLGSSPLTRGKRGAHVHDHGEDRLIPAHAGKTSSMRSLTRRRRAHPRSRGENHRPLLPGTGRSRLIPAHAGKTTVSTAAARSSEAHPRSRGENNKGAWAPTCVLGSSPLTRGKPSRRRASPVTSGLIPAHAGKT